MGSQVPETKRAIEMPWPLPVGEPYLVEDALGSWVEVIAPGAYEGAVSCDGDRQFVVAEDEWSDDGGQRRILRVRAVSER